VYTKIKKINKIVEIMWNIMWTEKEGILGGQK
jgi:hypothetical protein